MTILIDDYKPNKAFQRYELQRQFDKLDTDSSVQKGRSDQCLAMGDQEGAERWLEEMKKSVEKMKEVFTQIKAL